MTQSRFRRIEFQVFGVLVVAVLTWVSWFLWLGWDTEYQIQGGVETGPYEAPQVAGCVVSLLVVLAGALLIGVRPLLVAPALVLTFTTAWTWQAARQDDSGLYAVGAVALLLGLTAGTALVAAVVTALRASWLDRR
jgi:hypothetical protein